MIWLVLFNLILASTIAIINASAFPIFSSSVDGYLVIDAETGTWLSTMYLMFMASTVPISSWLAERYGYKIIFQVGLFLLGFGCVLCVGIDSFYVMLFGRCLSGIGAGIIFPITLTIINHVFPKTQISFALSLYVAGAFGAGLAFGFWMGGYIPNVYGWKYVFYILMVLCALSMFFTYKFHPSSEEHPVAPFDIIGFFLFVIFACSILVILITVKQQWNTAGWHSDFIRLFIALSVIFFAIFIAYEYKTNDPVFDLSLFKIRSFSIGCLALVFVGSLIFGTITTYGPGLENFFHYSKFKAGLVLIPFGIVLGVVGGVTSILTKYIGLRIPAVLGLLLVAISCFINHKITFMSDHMQMQQALITRAVGIGLSLGPLTALSLIHVPNELLTKASAIITLARQLGGAYGGSLIALISLERFPFHMLTFSEQVDVSSTAYQNHLRDLTQHFMRNCGSTLLEAKNQAVLIIADNMKAQANILSANDGFFVIGIFVFLIAFTLIALISYLIFNGTIKNLLK